ncbi:MAG: glycosyltransferase [Quadrisphaera sp.]
MVHAVLHAGVPQGVRPGVSASAAIGAGAPALLLGWTWLGSALGNARLLRAPVGGAVGVRGHGPGGAAGAGAPAAALPRGVRAVRLVGAASAGAVVVAVHTAVNAALLRRPVSAPPAVGERVSVLLPVRDEAHQVGRALAAVLASTGVPDLEVLVLDDGSTDGTAAAAACAAGGDPRVRVLTGAPLPAGLAGQAARAGPAGGGRLGLGAGVPGRRRAPGAARPGGQRRPAAPPPGSRW